MFCNTLSEYVVYTAVDGFCLVQIRTDQELCIVKSIEQVSANFQLFKELGICRLADISVSVVLLVSGGVVVHGLLQSSRYTHIVNDKTAFFVFEYAIDTGDGLHQIVSSHRLIDIHGCKGWNIEAR